jgi:glycosyltransferase involved in cell wall biosynthesis
VTAVYVVVPDSIDDPERPSGGNAYDRRICRELAALGWSVHERAVPGSWPVPDTAACVELSGVLAGMPDGSVVLLDGLIASAVPEVLVPEAARLRLVVLVHMPLGDGRSTADSDDPGNREREVLSAAAAVVTTSTWTRRELLDDYALRADQVHVAEPGVDVAQLAPGTTGGGELLCVAAVTPDKGYDLLIAALAEVAELEWRCVCVGASDLDPDFVDRLSALAHAAGIGDRVRFIGARTGADLAAQYAAADVLVLASRAETYGMVVTEALARGLPVIATAVGGLPDALGRAADTGIPGLLVPPDDSAAFAAALGRWLSETDLRKSLRRAAEERRTTLSPWSATSAQLSRVLAQVAV